MYLLINVDNTVNYGNDHPINKKLNFEGTRLIEFPEKTLYDVVGDIHPAEAYWDDETQTVIRHPKMVESEKLGERVWRNKELSSIVSKLDQYERDQRIPSEFRTTTITEYQYHEMLRYRKKLCDYPSSSNFDLKIRPTLNM